MKLLPRFALAAALSFASALPASAQEAKGATELTWFGHAAFQLKTPSGKIVLIDPWLTNPANPKGKEQLEQLAKADLILLSHGHSDHVGDSTAIARKTGAKLVATFDLGNAMVAYSGFPAKQTGYDTMGNFGGELSLLDGEVLVRLVPAVHGSTIKLENKPDVHAAGNPGGFVIRVKNGPTIYHTGDTDVFGDMALIGERTKIDYLLAPIGGHFTMDPTGAARAVKLIGAATVIPMHFGTFPVLKGTPAQLQEALKKEASKARVREMKIGETIPLK